MNIQNNCNINFGAKRILNVHNVLSSGVNEVVDVFVLGKEDKRFAARCLQTLQTSDRVLQNTSSNIKYSHESACMAYKNIFASFLRSLAGKRRDVLKFDDMSYLVAIKNGETISGVSETADYYTTATIQRQIFPNKDALTRKSLAIALITKFRDDVKKGLTNSALLSDYTGYTTPENFSKALRNIRAKVGGDNQFIKGAKFEKVKDSKEYDLEEFLGIKDIETEVMI